MTTEELETKYGATIRSRRDNDKTMQDEHIKTNSRYKQEFLASFPGPPNIERVIHEYEGPQGKGYILRFKATESDGVYWKSIDMGPEGRSHDWVKENTEEII